MNNLNRVYNPIPVFSSWVAFERVVFFFFLIIKKYIYLSTVYINIKQLKVTMHD